MATNSKTTKKPLKKGLGKDGRIPPEKVKPFSAENQPSPNAKSEGWRKRRRAQELVQAVLDLNFKGMQGSELKKKAAEYFCIPVDEITVEMMIIFRQAELAIQKADTKAADFIMDRAFGKPKQETVHKVHDLDKLPVTFE